MSNYKNFDIDEAQKLRLIYKKRRHYAKEKFLDDLISWQYFFGDKSSIVGVNISLTHCYSRKTVETALNDLNYKLTSFSTPHQRGLYGEVYDKSTNFCFIPNNSEPAED